MINALAYAGFRSPEPEAWKPFGTEILGVEVSDGPDGGVRVRVDDAVWRIASSPARSTNWTSSAGTQATPRRWTPRSRSSTRPE